jgi:hypothetical protein
MARDYVRERSRKAVGNHNPDRKNRQARARYMRDYIQKHRPLALARVGQMRLEDVYRAVRYGEEI